MTIDVNTRENLSVVTVTGDVDLLAQSELARVGRGRRHSHSILFDVSGLQNFDTTFLRFLIHLHDRANAREPTTIELTGVPAQLRRVLEVTGLKVRFPVRSRNPQVR